MTGLKQNLIAGLDIGTSKISIALAEYNQDHIPNIIGFGHHPSRGFFQGSVTDLEGLAKSISKAAEMAEARAHRKIPAVVVGISGTHIDSHNARAGVVISDRMGEIKRLNLDRAINAARDSVALFDRKVIHQLIQDVVVDGQSGIKEPVGMYGARLEVEVHIVTGLVSLMQNYIKAISYTGLEIRDVALSTLATSHAVLQQAQKDLGVILLDIGAALTGGLIYKDGVIKNSFNYPFGGIDLTKHISNNLKISFGEAESLKKKNQPETFKELIEPKLKGELNNIKKIISKTANLDSFGAGIVVAGCCSFTEGLLETIEDVFGLPATMGMAKDILCESTEVLSPIYTTSIGLIRYGLAKQKSRQRPPAIVKNRFLNAADRFREFISDYF